MKGILLSLALVLGLGINVVSEPAKIGNDVVVANYGHGIGG